MTAVAARETTTAIEKKGIDRGVMAVFAGLMLGSLVASLNLTLVAPALPTIVAELGGIADYSWITNLRDARFHHRGAGGGQAVRHLRPQAALHDGHRRVRCRLRALRYRPELLVPRLLSLRTGSRDGLHHALSQAIIGDIISPRERGKYQG